MRFFLVLCALILAAPATALASQRSGSANDPVGDSLGQPWQDIVSADAQYDTDGDLIVAARMNGDLKNDAQPPSFSQPVTYFQFRVAQYTVPSDCTGEGVFLAGFSEDPYDFVKIDGVEKTGALPIAFAGNNDIVFGAQGTLLANKGYSCMTLYVQDKGGGDRILDQLNVPLWFDGYGPSPKTGTGAGTGTGPSTSPGTATPAGAGAPNAMGTGTSTTPQNSATTCRAPTLKGKTLSVAKQLLAKADCRLGKVTKPKRVKRGVRLVVIKQTTTKSSVSLTLGPKPTHKH